MKRSILILAALFIGFNANAQFGFNKTVKGNGEMTSENRNTSSYDEINLVGSMDVELISGTEGDIKVEAESNLMEYIVTEVKGGTLKISSEDHINLNPSRNHSIKITVPFEDLEKVKVTGSGDLWNSDVIKADSFETALTGSGDINLNLEVNSLEGHVTGSGDTNVQGSANTFECKVTGSGDFKAFKLKAREVKATVMGSGDIGVYASDRLEARVMGSGDIKYEGDPEKQDFSAMGSGSISNN